MKDGFYETIYFFFWFRTFDARVSREVTSPGALDCGALDA
jgi:hypothetical protein